LSSDVLSRPASFLVAGVAGAATLAAASAPSPLYPVYQQLWGFSAFTLTVVFAVYVFALLVALLTVGSLSDVVGRRPVASGALLLLALGMVLFAVAGGTGDLMVARVVQGLAVGAATGTTTALIIDSAPSARTGSVVSAAVPTLGLALGAILAGGLVQHAPHPRQLVFWILTGVYVVLAGLVWAVPESARTQAASWAAVRRNLRPSAGLPAVVRPTFLALLPSIAATWALGGLYLSLGSSVVGRVLGVQDHLVVGLVLGAFFLAGAAGPVVAPALPEAHREWLGYAFLAAGVLVTMAAMAMVSLPLYVVGSVVGGLGFGASFRWAVGALGEAAPAAHRGEVFATMFVVSYLAFSVPALVAGLAVSHVGLEPTAVAYGALDVALVALATVAGPVRGRRAASRPAA
jgi:MFS family permease